MRVTLPNSRCDPNLLRQVWDNLVDNALDALNSLSTNGAAKWIEVGVMQMDDEVQVVVRDEAVAHSLRSEFCLKVTGQVGARPEGNANPGIPTGVFRTVLPQSACDRVDA